VDPPIWGGPIPFGPPGCINCAGGPVFMANNAINGGIEEDAFVNGNANMAGGNGMGVGNA